MVMQIKRTPNPDSAPSGLAEGQLAVEMASAPPKLWVGVPAGINPQSRLLLNTPVSVGATAPTNPANGDLWWHTGESELYIWLDAQSAWVKPAPSISNLSVNVVIFTASGTYTPSVNMVYAMVECIGGGGAGGAASRINNILGGGGGGGSGGYSRSTLRRVDIGVAQTVTVGAGGGIGGASPYSGGATSFGSLVIANGGTGGGWHNETTTIGWGGPGATRGTGQITYPGNTGFSLFDVTIGGSRIPVGGQGAVGFGGGSPSVTSAPAGSAVAGANAQANSGAGGSGAATNGTNMGGVADGGAGGSGICIVTEYIFG